MSLRGYSTLVAATVLVSLAALSSALGGRSLRAVAAGAALASANAVAAFALVIWSAERSSVTFFGAVLGGTLGRMALLLAATVVAVRGLGLSPVPFVTSLLAYFVGFLALELGLVHRMTASRQAEAGR